MKCESTVYLNKVFTDLKIQTCPLLSDLATTPETFSQQLTFYDPDGGCGFGCTNSCNCLEFGDDLNFVIENTQVFVSEFALAVPTTLTAANVTVNGIAVDSLDFENGRYVASINTLLSRISNCACLENGAATKAMLLITGAGPWIGKVTIVVHGSVFGCGTCKKFKLVMSTLEDVTIDIPGTSTFAVSDICLPCTKGGISPVINFSFLAKASLLNPVITTDTGTGPCNVILTGSLVTEPATTLQVTKLTLFTIDAEAVMQPCDDLRKCSQTPGVCSCQPEPTLPCNPCCESCSDNECPTEATCESSDGCDCGCNTQYSPQPPQICCQFNGINGCCL